MHPKLSTTLKRLLCVLAVALFLPACYASARPGYYRAGTYYPTRGYYERRHYRAPPPRAVIVVPHGHRHYDERHYYRAPPARHHRHHHHRHDRHYH